MTSSGIVVPNTYGGSLYQLQNRSRFKLIINAGLLSSTFAQFLFAETSPPLPDKDYFDFSVNLHQSQARSMEYHLV